MIKRTINIVAAFTFLSLMSPPLQVSAAIGIVERFPEDTQLSYGAENVQITPDGRYIVFHTSSSLVSSDTNDRADVYLLDRQTNNIERVSVTSSGAQLVGDSYDSYITPDARYATFVSRVSAGKDEVFLRDRLNNTTVSASTNSDNQQLSATSYGRSISDDGKFIAFVTPSKELLPNEYQNIAGMTDQSYVKDMQTGTVQWVSVDSNGDPGLAPEGAKNPHYNAGSLSISSDGLSAVFGSNQILAPGTTYDGTFYIYKKNLSTGQVTLVSKDTNGVGVGGASPVISRDGNYVAYDSNRNGITSNTNGYVNTFLYATSTDNTSLISTSSNGVVANSSGGGFNTIAISNDNRYIVFTSGATNLTADTIQQCSSTQYCKNIFRKDLQTGQTDLISVNVNRQGGNRDSHSPSLSGDGALVAFTSDASDLINGDTNKTTDIFWNDTTLVPDTTPPTGTFTGDTIVITALGQTIQGVAGDDLSGVAEVRLSTGATTLTSQPGGGLSLNCNTARTSCTWAATASMLPQGINTYTLTTSDLAGNTSTTDKQYLVN